MRRAGAVIERKLKHDGTAREYSCELAWLDGRVAVVRFPLPQGGSAFGVPVRVPPGSVSWGFFWARRPYNLYRIVSPEGVVLAHRFDAVTDVRLGEDVISYRDLVLDWWALPEGALLEEDREEFEALVLAAELGAGDVARAREAARQVYSRYRHVIDEAEALLRRIES